MIDYDSEGYIWSPVVALFVKMTDGLPIESALWFLPVLFFTFLMYIILERYIAEFKYRVLVIILITLLGCGITKVLYNYVLGGIGTAMSALAFFLIGNIISQNKEKVKNTRLFGNLLIFILVVLVNTLLIFLNGKLNMRTGEWAIIPLSYFNAVVGCGIYCKVAIWMDKSKLWRACLQYIGRNSIVFLCTNHLAIRISSKLLGLFLDSDGIINGILYWSLVFVIAMLGKIGRASCRERV